MKLKKHGICENLTFDLLYLTGSNIDSGPKITLLIASIRREQSACLFREALRRFVWKLQGGSPPVLAKVAKHRIRARVNATFSKNTYRYGEWVSASYFLSKEQWRIKDLPA